MTVTSEQLQEMVENLTEKVSLLEQQFNNPTQKQAQDFEKAHSKAYGLDETGFNKHGFR